MLQVKGVIVQLPVVMSKQSFFFLQLPVHVHVSNETMVVDGIEGDVDLSVEWVGASEGGKIHGVGD